jgi:hypothetical protein
MALDRQTTHGLVQALIRARNKKDGGNFLQNAAQTSALSGDGTYGLPALGGMEFPFASQPGVATVDEGARQSRSFLPTHPSYPFQEPSRSSLAGEAAGMAKARRLPVYDQLASETAPSTIWERLFPSYCTPTDETPTFPPLINQERGQLTEADKAACHEQYDRDEEACRENYSYNQGVFRRCRDRAQTIRDLCLRGAKEVLPWSDVDEDGIRFPTPPVKGRKRK